ncbi:MAG: TonB-dependent receptor [Bradyrhizobium sp.]|nr:TonB-dependent receptor [Bradyrhizobium sp.]
MRYATVASAVALAGMVGVSTAQAQSSPNASPPPAQDAAKAGAEDGVTRLEDIVVTAQRRSENLQDVPVAVTALSAASLESKGIASTTDLSAVTPGLTYTTVVGSALPRIRGIGTAISLGGNENPVATYVDGVYIASSAASVLSFNNIEQIAVLKGPQGTLFGRNATGGLIQITTRDPEQSFEGQSSLTVGNLRTLGGNLYVTGGLTDRLAADLAVFYQKQKDGFGRNLTTGSDVGQNRDLALRSKWRLELGPDTVARLAFDYSEARAAGPAFRPVLGTVPITGVSFTGGPYDIATETDPSLKRSQGGASVQISHDFGDVNFVSISAYRKSDFQSIFDIDKLPVHISRSNLTNRDRQFSQELQLLSTGPGPVQWVLGAYYFNSRGRYDPLVIDNVANDIVISSTQDTESYAVFGQGSYKFTDKTSLTAGLRYTTETRDYKASALNVLASGTVINNPTITGVLKAKKPSWRLALDHHFTDDVLGYVSYNRGFKSGGFNPQRFTQPLSPFKPEVLDALETGVKADLLDHRLRINGAAFYYDYSNIQANAFVSGISTIYNAASATIYGLDLDVTAAPISALVLTLGLTLIHDRYEDFPNAVISRPQVPNGTTILGGNVVGTGSAKGNKLSQTPDWTVNFGAEYDIDLATGSIRLSANYFHSDGWRAEPDNRVGQDSYDLVNASATWRIDEAENYSVKLWGRNLGDKVYAVQMNAQPQADGVSVGPGRTYGVTLGARF